MQFTRYSVPIPIVCICSQDFNYVFSKHCVICYGTTQPLSSQGCDLQIAHHKLVENELMIHSKVDATVPFIVKSNLDVFGSVEGAGVGWGFLKLQPLGRILQAVTLNMLPHFWSCAFQVQ